MHLKYVQIQKAACLQVFYLQFTSPQFYLYILPVYFVSKSKTFTEWHNVIRILLRLQIYATREDTIYVPKIFCYFNAVIA